MTKLPIPVTDVDPDELRSRIEKALEPLSSAERSVIRLRHGLDDGFTYPVDEAARRLEISPERVREIEAEAIFRLKKKD